ncbi:MAG: enoyl-CoA hydratase/isomerase family protein [Actinomadura sp.]
MADLEYSVADHVATILLNRPHRKNAFTMEMIDAWADALQRAEADADVRAVVVTGADGAFCSGVDLGVLGDQERTPLGQKDMLTRRIHKVAFAVEALTKPYLAAVDGPAVGAGMDMALMCDLRFAADTVRFCEGYIRVGLVPGDGGCYYLPRIVGAATALRLLWTGDFVEAEEALAIGLVSAVHPAAELLPAVREFAGRLAAQPPVAVQLIKRAVREGERHDLRTALDLISSHMGVVTSTRDSQEAMAAFTERRPGVYEGR